MITIQIVNSSAINEFIIDKGADVAVGLIVAFIVGVTAYYLGASNEKRKQKEQKSIDKTNQRKAFEELYPQLKKEIELNLDKAKQLRDFFGTRQYKYAAEAFTWTESSRIARSFSTKVFDKLNESDLLKFFKPEQEAKICEFYRRLLEWSKSIDLSTQACLSPTSNKDMASLAYIEVRTAGDIINDFNNLPNSID